MKTDIEIASEANCLPILEVAAKLKIPESQVIAYGSDKAKILPKSSPKGSLILVTAINPTPAGEGKSTISIGLADGMHKLGLNVALALREPSLGPVFGVKGGATGGGYAQIIPMEDINLHFTGDLHAINSANNLLCAMIDNHIYFGNQLNIKTVTFHRCMDVNDRALRNIVAGLGYNAREDSFDITAASEIMSVLCLASDFTDLKKRLGDIIVGYDRDGKPVCATDLKANEAMAILLKDAFKPNLVQTLENTPAFVHGGPFANIAHGCNSVIATKTALSYADYVVTEAGFGADLGAEKFIDIKCRKAGLSPKATVIVATVRALRSSGEGDLKAGIANLEKHIENMTNVFGLPTVVAINKFADDSKADLDIISAACKKHGVQSVLCECFAKGGEGAVELAKVVKNLCDTSDKKVKFAYSLTDSLEDKITAVAKKIYGADGVKFTAKARKSLERVVSCGGGDLPVCIAKTQYSLSDNAALHGRPSGFDITVKDVLLRRGAGFVAVIAGDILLMPALPRVPNAEKMTIDGEIISGLF